MGRWIGSTTRWRISISSDVVWTGKQRALGDSHHMKIRTLAAAAVVAAAVAVNAHALSDKFADFGKGPEQFLMTREELAQWKTVRSDADAQAFIDLFWLR